MDGVAHDQTKTDTINPNLTYQMARARQADLLREAEEYRRPGLTARPTALSRVTARIARFAARIRHSHRAPPSRRSAEVEELQAGRSRQRIAESQSNLQTVSARLAWLTKLHLTIAPQKTQR
jgi:hypothetical protein